LILYCDYFHPIVFAGVILPQHLARWLHMRGEKRGHICERTIRCLFLRQLSTLSLVSLTPLTCTTTSLFSWKRWGLPLGSPGSPQPNWKGTQQRGVWKSGNKSAAREIRFGSYCRNRLTLDLINEFGHDASS